MRRASEREREGELVGERERGREPLNMYQRSEGNGE